jgi:hypothetical protein
MEKELNVPDELVDLMVEWAVCIQCRDECIKSIFKARRAIYYGKLAEKANRKFWKMVNELYPETKTGVWSYSPATEKLFSRAAP